MIPLWDASRRPVEFPIMTALIIAANAIVFALELANGDAFIIRWSAVPAGIMAGHHVETLLTAMFLHGGWAHILGNMVFLWAFGPVIEDEMGPGRFLVFYLLGGAVSIGAQILADPASTVPTLGASGAIAAVMGGFLVMFPRDKIRTVLFLGIFVTMAFVPAALLIGLWFVIQVVSVHIGAGQADGVAYLAHVTGAVYGAIAVYFFDDPRRNAELI
jgi:membrane associated rhomboid family serine protease